jgi:hypothetical protein
MIKKFFFIFICAALSMVTQSCLIYNSNAKKSPPGQVKKATGSQSAKPYAPGQQKKKH